jgi:hypothetical protein
VTEGDAELSFTESTTATIDSRPELLVVVVLLLLPPSSCMCPSLLFPLLVVVNVGGS